MLGNLDDSRLLFRRHRAQATGVIHRLDDDLVRYDVELLLNFALPILGFRRAEDVGETGHADLAGDHLRGEPDVVQDAGELAGGLRMLALLLDDEPLDGDDRRCGVSDHAVLRSLASSARELGCYMMSQALRACSCPSRLIRALQTLNHRHERDAPRTGARRPRSDWQSSRAARSPTNTAPERSGSPQTVERV